MSMNYGIVRPSFWTGPTGRALRQDIDAQVVALYLMTSPHANIIGVFRCPIDYIKIETGRSFEGASKGLDKLCEIGFCTVDPDSETIWVHEMARFQIGEDLKGADKRIKHVVRFFNEIENPRIKWAFFKKYGAAYQLPKPAASDTEDTPSEGASKPLQSPIEATVTVTDTFTGNSAPSELAPAPLDPSIPEREYFLRGREVLGKGAGGLIGKLLKAKGGNVALARAAIEHASQKQNPTEYVAAICRGPPVVRPTTAHQQERQTGREILDDIGKFISSSGGEADPGLLRYDSGDGPEGIRGGIGGNLIELSASSSRTSG